MTVTGRGVPMQLTGLLSFNATSAFKSGQELCYPLVYVVYIIVENMANYSIKNVLWSTSPSWRTWPTTP